MIATGQCYRVVRPFGRGSGPLSACLPGDPPPPVTIKEVPEGQGYSLVVAFRLAAKLAKWPFGLVLEPVAHEVVP
jgi:hypothetical protein